MIQIYGKASCPYTSAAREHYEERGIPFEYLDVKKDPTALQRMMDLTLGQRHVPVIVEDGKVTIGFGGT